MEFRRVLVRSCELLVVLFGALVSQQRERRISHHGPVHRLPVRRVAQTCGELRILEYVNGCLAETGERFSFLQAKDLESPSDTYGIISTVGVKIHGANQPFYWGRRIDRKSVVEGKSVSERVDLGDRRIIKKKKEQEQNCTSRRTLNT